MTSRFDQLLEQLKAAKGDDAALALVTFDFAVGDDAGLKEIAEAAALPHWFDDDILKSLVATPDEEGKIELLKTKLAMREDYRMPSGKMVHNLQATVREGILKRMALSDPLRLRILSHRANRCFAELADDPARCYSDPRNRAAARVESIYHELLASPIDGDISLLNYIHACASDNQLEQIQALRPIVAEAASLKRLFTSAHSPDIKPRSTLANASTSLEGLSGSDRLTPEQSAMPEQVFRAIEVFISYSHKDSKHLEALRIAIDPHSRCGEIKVWADPLLEPGEPWRADIHEHLDAAEVFILMVSPDSIASDFVMTKELPRAMERRSQEKCEILPVVVRPCAWKKTLLGELQVVASGKSISEAKSKDVAWHNFTKELDRVITRCRAKKGRTGQP